MEINPDGMEHFRDTLEPLIARARKHDATAMYQIGTMLNAYATKHAKDLGSQDAEDIQSNAYGWFLLADYYHNPQAKAAMASIHLPNIQTDAPKLFTSGPMFWDPNDRKALYDLGQEMNQQIAAAKAHPAPPPAPPAPPPAPAPAPAAPTQEQMQGLVSSLQTFAIVNADYFKKFNAYKAKHNPNSNTRDAVEEHAYALASGNPEPTNKPIPDNLKNLPEVKKLLAAAQKSGKAYQAAWHTEDAVGIDSSKDGNPTYGIINAFYADPNATIDLKALPIAGPNSPTLGDYLQSKGYDISKIPAPFKPLASHGHTDGDPAPAAGGAGQATGAAGHGNPAPSGGGGDDGKTKLTKPHASVVVAAWQEAMNAYEVKHNGKQITVDGLWGKKETGPEFAALLKELNVGSAKDAIKALAKEGISIKDNEGHFEIAPAATPGGAPGAGQTPPKP